MTSANPPSIWFSGINYNPNLFSNTSGAYLTLSYMNSHYVKSTGIAVSSATSTTFSSNVYATNNANSVVSIINSLVTNGTTSTNTYYVPFVPTNVTSTNQAFYTDSSADAIRYKPSSNALTLGGMIVNGNVQVDGTGIALNAPNGAFSSVNTTNGLTIGTLGYSYTTLPSLVTGQIGYKLSITGNNPSTLTSFSGALIPLVSGGTSIGLGTWEVTVNINVTTGSATAGCAQYGQVALSTTSGGANVYNTYPLGSVYFPASTSGSYINYTSTRIIKNTATRTLYINYIVSGSSGFIINALGSNSNATFTRIA